MLSAIAALFSFSTMEAAIEPPAPASSEERKICRKQDRTGSLLHRRICKTRGEWAQGAKQDAANIERFRNLTQQARSNDLQDRDGRQ
jgi:hypothetical protein